MPKATVTKSTFWTKAKQHKRFYFTDGSQNSADGERNPTGCSSLSLSFFSSFPQYIYMNACVHTQNSKASVLMKYSKGFHRSRIYPFSNILLTLFRTEMLQPMAGYQRGNQEARFCPWVTSVLWYIFGQAILLCSFFFSSHTLSSLFLF